MFKNIFLRKRYYLCVVKRERDKIKEMFNQFSKRENAK